MAEIRSKVIPNGVWQIERRQYYSLEQLIRYHLPPHDHDIIARENEFIENFNPSIYFNDLTCHHWCYDIKLPSGYWLENIRVIWANGKRIFTALIVC